MPVCFEIWATVIVFMLVCSPVVFIFLFQWLLPDGFQSLMALVGTNGQGVCTSPFSEWVKKVSELELPTDEKQQLDSFIDKLYEDLNEGGTASTQIVGHYLRFTFQNPALQ
jgi:hypothetical protein